MTLSHLGKIVKTRRNLALMAFVVLAIVATGCYDNNTGAVEIGGDIQFTMPAFPETGSHAVEMWTEMHFQPSYRVQEGPRLLPPEGSVPVTGAELVPVSLDDYQQLQVPAQVVARYDDSEGVELYRVNCQVCHGVALDGQGPIMQLQGADGDLAYDKGPLPADLRIDVTKNSTDGEIFGFISGGGRQGLAARLRGRDSTSPMPEFSKMLTEEERWVLVQFLRARIGR